MRLIHVAVAAYFNELPLTRNIAVNLIHSYIDDALPDAIDYGIQRGWLVEIEEHGWPDNMRGMPVKVGSLHLRPTRIGIYRTIEAITWIMDCVHRVDDQINRRDFNQSLDTFRDRWPISSTAVAGVKSNNLWQTLGVA